MVGMISRVEQLAARQAHNLKVDGSSPSPATEYTCSEIARALRVSERSVQRHVVVLAQLGALGIRRAKRAGDRRWRLLVSDELLGQWKRGELPAPWQSAIKSVAS